MKALRHLPEWNPSPAKNEKHAIAKNAKMALLPKPYSDMTTLQVCVSAYITGKGKITKYFGRGSETLYCNAGNLNDEEEVTRKAEAIHSIFITHKPAPMNEV
jgi:hypothetical protein